MSVRAACGGLAQLGVRCFRTYAICENISSKRIFRARGPEASVSYGLGPDLAGRSNFQFWLSSENAPIMARVLIPSVSNFSTHFDVPVAFHQFDGASSRKFKVPLHGDVAAKRNALPKGTGFEPNRVGRCSLGTCTSIKASLVTDHLRSAIAYPFQELHCLRAQKRLMRQNKVVRFQLYLPPGIFSR